MSSTPRDQVYPCERLRIYISSSAQLFTDEQLAKLLETSRRNNARVGITGLLLYSEGSIFQAFEGPADAVETLHARIALDPRHRGIINLVQKDSTIRSFSDWSMGLVTTSRATLEGMPGLSDFLSTGRVESGLTDRQTLILLNHFRASNIRVA